MTALRRTTALALATVLAACVPACRRAPAPPAGTRLPYYDDAALTPRWVGDGDDRGSPTAAHTIAPFQLLDQEGRKVSERDLDRKVHVASFVFTSCSGICPVLVKNLRRVQAAYRSDPRVLLISYSVTPRIDTVAVLARYAADKGIESGKWRLLTGDTDTIYALARDSYRADEGAAYGKGSDDLVHTETLLLVDGERRIRGVYNGTLPLDIDRLIEDIGTLETRG